MPGTVFNNGFTGHTSIQWKRIRGFIEKLNKQPKPSPIDVISKKLAEKMDFKIWEDSARIMLESLKVNKI